MTKTPKPKPVDPSAPPGAPAAEAAVHAGAAPPQSAPSATEALGEQRSGGDEDEFRGGFRQGASDAAEAVATVLPLAGRWVSRSVYGACYLAGYAAVFGALTLSRLLPDDGAVLNGLRDGGSAARSDLEAHQRGGREGAPRSRRDAERVTAS